MPNLTITTERISGLDKNLHVSTNTDGSAYILISDQYYNESVGFVLTADERWELIEFLSRES